MRGMKWKESTWLKTEFETVFLQEQMIDLTQRWEIYKLKETRLVYSTSFLNYYVSLLRWWMKHCIFQTGLEFVISLNYLGVILSQEFTFSFLPQILSSRNSRQLFNWSLRLESIHWCIFKENLCGKLIHKYISEMFATKMFVYSIWSSFLKLALYK